MSTLHVWGLRLRVVEWRVRGLAAEEARCWPRSAFLGGPRSRPWFSEEGVHPRHLGGWANQIAGPHSHFWFAGPREGPRTCVSNPLPGDSGAAGRRHTLRTTVQLFLRNGQDWGTLWLSAH